MPITCTRSQQVISVLLTPFKNATINRPWLAQGCVVQKPLRMTSQFGSANKTKKSCACVENGFEDGIFSPDGDSEPKGYVFTTSEKLNTLLNCQLDVYPDFTLISSGNIRLL